MAIFTLYIALIVSLCFTLGLSLKAHGLGIASIPSKVIESNPFLVKHHDDETSDPELDTPTYMPTHIPTAGHHSKSPVLSPTDIPSSKSVLSPTEIPSSRPSLVPEGPSSNAELVGFVTFAFFISIVWVLSQYCFRKAPSPPSSEDGIDLTNSNSRADTNTAYGSTYHKVQGSDKA